MMAFGGQAWSGFWDPVQYRRVMFFFLSSFFFASLLPFSSLYFLSVYLFFPSCFSGSVSSAWFFNLVSFFLIASNGL